MTGRALAARAARFGARLRGSPAATAGGWGVLSAVVAHGLGAARVLVVARLVGPGETGAAAAALLAVATLDALSNTGVDGALVGHPGRAEDDLDAAFTVQAVRGALLAAALWLTAPLVAWCFALPAVAPMVRALALVPLARGLANPALSLLVRRLEFRRLFWWSLPEAATGFALGVGLAAARRDAWALVVAAIAAQGIATLASYAAVPRRPRAVFGGAGQRALLRHGRWVGGARCLMFVSVYADKLFVGRLLGAAALGVYQLGFRIAELPAVSVGRAAAQLALPALAALRGEPDRLRARFGRLLRPVVAVHLVFAAAMLPLAPAGAALLGAEWRPVAPVAQLLALAMVFRAVLVVSTELLYAVGLPRAPLFAHLLRTGVLLLATYPLVRALGAPGAAVAVLGANVAGMAACLRSVRGATGIRARDLLRA